MNGRPPSISTSGTFVLNALRAEPRLSQRELARRAGVSLGTVNLLLRRLATAGLVEIGRGEGRCSYAVTKRGEDHSIRDSYARVSNALRELSLVEKTVQVEVLQEYARGGREAIIIGDGDLAKLAESAVRALALRDLRVDRLPAGTPPPQKGFVLLDAPRAPQSGRPGVRALGEFTGVR